MAKRIITISREFGSGGRFIGEEVAKKLGIAYYDKEMIGQIAEQAGLSSAYVLENAELSPKKGWFAYAFSGRDITGKSVEDMVYEAQRKVIMEIAEKENCVIVGRNADFILKDRKDVLNVFIHGSIPEKVRRICSLYNVTEVDAIKMINDIDKRRRTNYNFYTEQKWGMACNYTLSLNSSQLGYEKCMHDFSRYLYVTQMKHTPIFLNENRKKRRKLCAYCTKTCVKIITYIDKVQK